MLSRHGACRIRSRTWQARWASWPSNVATPNGWRPTTTPGADWPLTPPPPSKTYGQPVHRSAEQISPSAPELACQPAPSRRHLDAQQTRTDCARREHKLATARSSAESKDGAGRAQIASCRPAGIPGAGFVLAQEFEGVMT